MFSAFIEICTRKGRSDFLNPVSPLTEAANSLHVFRKFIDSIASLRSVGGIFHFCPIGSISSLVFITSSSIIYVLFFQPLQNQTVFCTYHHYFSSKHVNTISLHPSYTTVRSFLSSSTKSSSMKQLPTFSKFIHPILVLAVTVALLPPIAFNQSS